MNVRFPYEGELLHYFRHSEFGPASAQLEILSGTTSAGMAAYFGEVTSSKVPRWPVGAFHSTMIRVRDRLVLAEGRPLLGKSLPPGAAFSGSYGSYQTEREWFSFSWGNHLAKLERRATWGKPGAWITLWAYYGPYGRGRRYAEGTNNDNTKDGAQECDDPKVALWPLLGGIIRETRGDDLDTLWDMTLPPERKRARKRGQAEGVREAIDRARRDIKGEHRRELNARSEELLTLARGAYIRAAKLHDALSLAEVTCGV
jgi:hypothetical protein